MSAWLHLHWAALRLALRRLTIAPLNTLLAVLVIGIALALPAGGWVLLANLQSLAAKTAPAARISLYLPVEAERRMATELGTRLKADPTIKSLQFLPREDTLKRMKGSAGLADVIDALPGNPFPDAYVITPADESPAATEALAATLRALPHVEHVQLDSAWVRRLDAMLRLGRIGLTTLAALLIAGLIAITFNTIRLQVMTQRAEIEVCRLLGATEAFIRRPYLYSGAMQGLGGGLLAWAIVALALAALQTPVNELAALYSVEFALRPATLAEALALPAIAAVTGLLGAALSLRQHIQKT